MGYIPNTEQDNQEMLATIGVKNVEELLQDIPIQKRLKSKLNLPTALSEFGLNEELKILSKKNATVEDYVCFLGAGAYDHYIPKVVNYVTSKPEFYTSYTPYQPEISQGMLQAIFEYQSLICQLTGMEVANASLYDGATALVEAIHLAHNVNQKKKIILAQTIHPEYRQVVKTYTKNSVIEVKEISYKNGIIDLEELSSLIDDQTGAVVIQQPNFFGCLEKVDKIAEIAHQKKALFIVVFYPISLGLLAPPGKYGADIAVGEGQCLGLPLSFGGPYLGLFSCRQEFIRKVPGRIVGQTQDNQGRRGFVLTLQTREQHIRREHATSNICSNEALCALAAGVYLASMGSNNLKKVAELCLQKAHYLAENIIKAGGKLKFSSPFFNEFVVTFGKKTKRIRERLLKNKILPGLELGKFFPELSDCLLFCVTEKRTRNQIDSLIKLVSTEKA